MIKNKFVLISGYALIKSDGLYICDDLTNINAGNSIRIIPRRDLSKYNISSGDKLRASGKLVKSGSEYIIKDAVIKKEKEGHDGTPEKASPEPRRCKV